MDFTKRRSRKDKLVLRDWGDENAEIQEEPNTSTSNHQPFQFDIKVEVEPCDEESISMSLQDCDSQQDINIKSENEADDFFEAEEHDINQLALTLTGSIGESSEVTANDECPSLDDEEQRISAIASALINERNNTGKRKRIPNIKKEYVYDSDEIEAEESDVNTLARFLQGTSQVKSEKEEIEKPSSMVSKDLAKKIEMWKNLHVSDNEISDSDVESVPEPKSMDVKKEPICEVPGQYMTTVQDTKFWSCTGTQLKQLRIDDQVIMDELENVSKKLTSKADKMLDIEMRNLWGRVRRTPHVTTEQEKKVLKALTEWWDWSKSVRVKEPPAMYKCYICEKAWWHFNPFSEHVNGHSEHDLKVITEVNCYDCYIVAVYHYMVPKYFPIEGDCWRCGWGLDVHTKMAVTNSAKNYSCDCCYKKFTNCRLLREHSGICGLRSGKNVDDSASFLFCPICVFTVKQSQTNAEAEFSKHMQFTHAVRSDVPMVGRIGNCLQCYETLSVYYFHMCSKKPRTYQCQYCCKRFYNRITLDIHTSQTTPNFKCRICRLVLPRSCMEMVHLIQHTDNFTLMYKCMSCTEKNILVADEAMKKKHKLLWHKQRYDKRWNNFEPMVVPKHLIEMQKVNSIESNGLVTPRKRNRGKKAAGTQKSPTPKHKKSSYEDDGDVTFVESINASELVIELNDDDDDDDNRDNINHANTDDNRAVVTNNAERDENANNYESDENRVAVANNDHGDENRDVVSNNDESNENIDVTENNDDSTDNKIVVDNNDCGDENGDVDANNADSDENRDEDANNYFGDTNGEVNGDDYDGNSGETDDYDNEPVNNEEEFESVDYKASMPVKEEKMDTDELLSSDNGGFDESMDVNTEDDEDVEGTNTNITDDLQTTDIQVKIEMEEVETETPYTNTNVGYTKKVMYKCNMCTFQGSLVKIKNHMEKTHAVSDDEKSFPCSKCGVKFESALEYCVHLSDHNLLRTCPECYHEFKTYKDLNYHINRHIYLLMRIKKLVQIGEAGLKMVDGKVQVKAKYQCWKCKMDVKPKARFAHWESHIVGGANQEPGVAGRDPDDQPVKTLTPELLKSVLALLTKKARQTHMTCLVCERIFLRSQGIKRHLIEHLLQDAYNNRHIHKSLKCQICAEEFIKEGGYRLHMRQHGGMVIYECNQCGKTFSDSSNHSKHKKTHDIDAHACAVCGKKFMAWRSLVSHQEVHKSDPIRCAQCDHICFSSAERKRHVRYAHQATMYRCKVCKRRFITMRERTQHYREHHGELPMKATREPRMKRKQTEKKQNKPEKNEGDDYGSDPNWSE